MRMLVDVAENPFTPLTERYEEFASDYQGNRSKDELVDAGLVIERNVRAKPMRRKLLQLTEKGRQYLSEIGVDVDREGGGGIVHQFWQHRMKEKFEEAGWTPKLELLDADVYVHLGDAELVVEVAMENKEREVDHVKQHLDTGFDCI
jgi:DNA-binding PadR family transcriptional regulator